MKRRTRLLGLLIFSSIYGFSQDINLTPHDSLIRNYLIKEWDISKSENTIKQIDMELSRKGRPYKEITIQPDGYTFKVYDFSGFHGIRPFVIEALDSADRHVSFFTFSDEYYYLEDELSELKMNRKGKWDIIKINDTVKDSICPRNLERNLNQLITKLGYNKDSLYRANLLFEAIFIDLLEMQRFSYKEWEYMHRFIGKARTEDERIKSYLKEYFNLDNESIGGKRYFPILKSREGAFGYWLFDVTESGFIKVKFVSELLFK